MQVLDGFNALVLCVGPAQSGVFGSANATKVRPLDNLIYAFVSQQVEEEAQRRQLEYISKGEYGMLVTYLWDLFKKVEV